VTNPHKKGTAQHFFFAMGVSMAERSKAHADWVRKNRAEYAATVARTISAFSVELKATREKHGLTRYDVADKGAQDMMESGRSGRVEGYVATASAMGEPPWIYLRNVADQMERDQ
jgi:hypothetical protein